MSINLSQFLDTADVFGLDDNFGFTLVDEIENNTRDLLLRWNGTGTKNEMDKYTGIWPLKGENLFRDSLPSWATPMWTAELRAQRVQRCSRQYMCEHALSCSAVGVRSTTGSSPMASGSTARLSAWSACSATRRP